MVGARRQLEKYLSDDAMCELLAISHHTLRSVEFGPRLESKKRGAKAAPPTPRWSGGPGWRRWCASPR